ncbi:hypothetical protein [Macrococcoides bohemicum]|uniref:hypothetical protein n=1 Tax=Macrococcoides bohemicum TaxID=1903056 RepID=UPI00165D484D|nr:hypothetical protein [Macrococcus bohemicus]MBC9875550.1 hypothetical protein [Macrococcus bohemicus]
MKEVRLTHSDLNQLKLINEYNQLDSIKFMEYAQDQKKKGVRIMLDNKIENITVLDNEPIEYAGEIIESKVDIIR